MSAMAGDSLLLGVVLAAGAAACYDGAVALQAADARETHDDDALRVSLLFKLMRKRRWMLGSLLALAGWPLQIGALALAPLTAVQPTMSLGLILLLFLGSRMLNERVGRIEIGATLAIATGVAAIALVAPAHTNPAVVLWKLAVVGGLLMVIAALPYLARARRRLPVLLTASAGAAYTLGAVATKLITDDAHRGRTAYVVAWVAITVGVTLIGMLSETTALQRSAATKVAPAIFVVQAVLPVLAAPLLVGERWQHPEVLLPALAVVALGAGVLGASRQVADLVGASHAD